MKMTQGVLLACLVTVGAEGAPWLTKRVTSGSAHPPTKVECTLHDDRVERTVESGGIYVTTSKPVVGIQGNLDALIHKALESEFKEYLAGPLSAPQEEWVAYTQLLQAPAPKSRHLLWARGPRNAGVYSPSTRELVALLDLLCP